MRLRLVSLLGLASLGRTAVPQSPADKTLVARRDNCDFTTWNKVSAELKTLFSAGGGLCNDDARAAIRLVFHDCGTWDKTQGSKGGCDGSLVLSAAELGRSENTGLAPIAQKVGALATKYNVPVADMVVFAGNKATVVCPGGPKVKTFIGRKDSSTPAPDGKLPDVNAQADTLFKLFQDKGFSAEDLAALLGAHSTSTQFTVDTTHVNASQDSTPGQWDVLYYKETLDFANSGDKPDGVFVFPSDEKLALHKDVGPAFADFVGRQGKWTSKFSDAMERMTLFGNNKDNMADCTNAL